MITQNLSIVARAPLSLLLALYIFVVGGLKYTDAGRLCVKLLFLIVFSLCRVKKYFGLLSYDPPHKGSALSIYDVVLGAPSGTFCVFFR